MRGALQGPGVSRGSDFVTASLPAFSFPITLIYPFQHFLDELKADSFAVSGAKLVKQTPLATHRSRDLTMIVEL
jgi:hypothetical protein